MARGKVYTVAIDGGELRLFSSFTKAWKVITDHAAESNLPIPRGHRAEAAATLKRGWGWYGILADDATAEMIVSLRHQDIE